MIKVNPLLQFHNNLLLNEQSNSLSKLNTNGYCIAFTLNHALP